jgi:PBSX family phage terminase large subunit
MEFTPHANQEEVLDDNHKIVLVIAGKRGGKTTIGAIKFISTIMANMKANIHDDYLISGPTYRLLKNATLPTLSTYWPSKLGIYKKSDSCIDLCDGHKVFIVSCEDEDKLEGFKARSCWLDEGGQVSRVAFNKIWQRLTPAAGEEQGQLIITTTPYGVPSSWLNKDLIENRKNLDYVGYFNWPTSSNPHMSSVAIEEARKMMDPRIFKRDYEGIFTNIVGLIYPDFDRTVDCVSPAPIDPTWLRYAGLDYGFSDPTAIVVFAKHPDKEEYILEDSFYKSKADLDEIGKFLQSQTNLKEVRYDPSAIAMMEELRKKVRVNLQSADNSVDSGIARITGLMKKHVIKIFNTEEEVILDLESYIYDEGKNKPKHENSHAPDAIRYCFTGPILSKSKARLSSMDASDKLDKLRAEFMRAPWDDKYWVKAPKNIDQSPSNRDGSVEHYGLNFSPNDD